MSLIQEFLLWRKQRKAKELVQNSWFPRYENHPPTEPKTVHGQYKVKNPMLMTDEEALNVWLDHAGLYSVQE
jgi:hypothetical protein